MNHPSEQETTIRENAIGTDFGPKPTAVVRGEIRTLLLLNALIIIPVLVTLGAVTDPPPTPTDCHTPYGYTLALLIWSVPTAALLAWLFSDSQMSFERGCCFRALTLLIPIGFVLDLLFGNNFFRYPNLGATLGFNVPALGGPLPIEEFVFFVTAFSFVVLTYVWADGSWLNAYHVSLKRGLPTTLRHRLRPSVIPFLIAVAVIAIASAHKRFWLQQPNGFPGYLAYVLLVAIAPPAACFRSVAGAINWRAFAFTHIAMVLVCVIFEATLGLRFGWWAFREHMMAGIYLRGWSNLPIEELLVWLAATFTCVTTYELVRLMRL